MRLTPGLTAIYPALGAAATSIAGSSGGVSRIAGAAEYVIEGCMNLKDAVENTTKQAMAIKQVSLRGMEINDFICIGTTTLKKINT